MEFEKSNNLNFVFFFLITSLCHLSSMQQQQKKDSIPKLSIAMYEEEHLTPF